MTPSHSDVKTPKHLGAYKGQEKETQMTENKEDKNLRLERTTARIEREVLHDVRIMCVEQEITLQVAVNQALRLWLDSLVPRTEQMMTGPTTAREALQAYLHSRHHSASNSSVPETESARKMLLSPEQALRLILSEHLVPEIAEALAVILESGDADMLRYLDSFVGMARKLLRAKGEIGGKGRDSEN